MALLSTAVPLLRDLLVRKQPGSSATLAAIGYGALLSVCFIAIHAAGISWAEIGVRVPTVRSVVLGMGAGLLVVAPVWRLPPIAPWGAGWLLIAVAVEELVFRGVLFAILRRAGGLPLAIGGSATAFTAAHAASAAGSSLVLVALAGLFLGLLRAIRGDLWSSGVAHLVLDLVSFP